MNILSTTATALAIALGLILLGVGLLALRKPIIAKLGLRNIPRRPAQSVLIVVGLTLSTLIIVSALSLGDTLNRSVQRHAVNAYGMIDQVVSPAFLGDLMALAEDGAVAGDSEQVQLLNDLAAGDLASILSLLENGLPGIDQNRYDELRGQLANEPMVDGVAGSIIFPTIVRNVNTGQGEPLGFIFAVDENYTQEMGLHDRDGRAVRMGDLQPGVGNIFVGAANLFAGTQALVGDTAARFGVEDVGVVEAGAAIAAVGALLTTNQPLSTTLRSLSLDVPTLRGLGIDTTFLEQQGITQTLSLQSLGLTDEQLGQLNIDPDAPVTLPTLEALGLDITNPLSTTTALLSSINLNTLGQDIDATLSQYGLQLRQGDVYLNELGAQQLNARPGDLLEIFVGPIPVPYRVRAIVQESGPMGALTPVVMLDVSEAQKLLFMSGRINSILISNRGDEVTGMALTDPVNEVLRSLSLNDGKLATAIAILRGEEVSSVIISRADSAQNPTIDMEGAPQFLTDFAEQMMGVTGFQEQIQVLKAAVDPANPLDETAFRAALGSTAVREWLLDLPLPGNKKADLTASFDGLDDFEVLSPLSKQFVVNAADIAGVAFGSMFSIFGAFSILAGILLIFLIYVMMAAERRAEMGIARAVGMQRGHLVQMFVTEGLVYDLAAALLGLGLGLLVSYAMIGFIRGVFGNFTQQVTSRAIPFEFVWSVAPTSMIIAYCVGVILTFVVVTIASWQVSRLNIVAAIRDLPDQNGISRLSTPGKIWRAAVGPLLLGVGGYLLWLAQEEGQTLTLIAITFLLFGGGLIAGWLLERTRLRAVLRERIIYTVIGLGLLVLWAVPWTTITGLESALFSQNPAWLLASFVVSGPLIIAGAILVVMFNADTIAGLFTRVFGGIGVLAPVLKTAIAYPLSARFRTGTTMLLFAMVITTVTIMSIVINATETIATPSEEATAGFDVKLSSGLLSFFDPATDLAVEAATRPDFPSDAVAVMGSVSRLDAEARQAGPSTSGWDRVGLTGIDAGYAQQAATVYPFAMRAAGYADDAAVWKALGERDDVAVIAAFRVADRPRSFGGGPDPDEMEHGSMRRGYFTLGGFAWEEGGQLPPITMELRFGEGDAAVARTVQVIGVLESDETLAAGSVQMNRAVLDALNGEPVRPESFYVKLVDGVDQVAAAQALEKSMLSSGLDATLLAEQFAAGQAVLRGILQLFQGFLALGLLVGIAGLGVISSRAVVERRQQVGMLRAIGYQKGMVSLAFLLESSFIALSGILIGGATGLALADKMIGQFYTLATDQTFPVPWLSIGGMLLVAWLFSLITTILPAWQASRVYPAEALRYE
ncbi:MAG: ABC transporter permease [Caldilineaceae bacterium]|nr:ABC transporter permease [Caldilineaceae bacterium]